MGSVDYYNKYADAFYKRTIHLNVSEKIRKFLSYLPEQATILDVGCGIGRDSKFFINQGHKVIACDASDEMVRLASKELGQEVLKLYFHELNFIEKFDGIWANASLLHISYEELPDIIYKLHQALKPSGIFYASFKYGNSSRKVEERMFFDMNEDTIEPYIKGLFEPIDIWQSEDTRNNVAASPHKSWLNIICRRLN